MAHSYLFFIAHLDQWFYFLFFSVLTVLFYDQVVRKLKDSLRLYIINFSLIYTLVCLMGGILVGVSEGDWLLQLLPQGGYRILNTMNVKWLLYWFLIYLPLFLLPTCLWAVDRFLPWPHKLSQPVANNSSDYFLLLILIIAFFVGFRDYSLKHFLIWFKGGGDFSSMIRQRGSTLSSINFFTLNLYYILAPTFFIVLCHKFYKKRSLFLFLVLPILLFLILTFTILTYQKLLFFMTLLCAGLFLLTKKTVPFSLFLGGCLLMPLSLAILSLFANNSYDFIEVLFHFVLRTGSALVYYVSLAHDRFVFWGYDLPLDGRSTEDNIEVFRYMFPESSWFGGSSSSPFHLRAYFQSGFVFLILEFFAVAVVIRSLIAVADYFKEAALYFQALALVFFFYLCQTSLKDCLISSYGIIFSLILLIVIFDMNRIKLNRKRMSVLNKM